MCEGFLFFITPPTPPPHQLPSSRPEILKQEIKVFFVKYNDPIYVKLEKLDIMIRLASQANIAQVSLEFKWLPFTLRTKA